MVMINLKQHKFTPQAILARALEYGIAIYLKDDNLTVEVPADLDYVKKDKALEVIRDSKEAIIAYLSQENERYQREVDEYVTSNPLLCCVCLGLDMPRETPVLPDDYEGFMYCVDHHPTHKRIEVVDGVRNWQT